MKIFFTSGKSEQVEITKTEFDKTIEKMKMGGVRFLVLPNGVHVPLNSNTIEYVDPEEHRRVRLQRQDNPTVEQHIDSIKEEIKSTKEELATEMGVQDRERPAETQKNEVNSVTGAEREANILKEIIAKSDCAHEEDKLKLCKSVSKKGERYFWVCSFCTWRSKFIKAESLTQEQKDTAQTFAY
jgi:septal ring factor EnvC (AmiA/AmiB activator)